MAIRKALYPTEGKYSKIFIPNWTKIFEETLIILVGSVNVKKGVDRVLFLTFLIICTVVDIYLGCKKNKRHHPRNSQNGFYRPDFRNAVSLKTNFIKLIPLHTNRKEVLYRSIFTEEPSLKINIFWVTGQSLNFYDVIVLGQPNISILQSQYIIYQ